METIAERIHALRLERGMTQTDLAKAVGVSSVAIRNWEIGKSVNIRYENMVALAKALKTSTDWLQTGMEWSNSSRSAKNEVPNVPILDQYQITRYLGITKRAEKIIPDDSLPCPVGHSEKTFAIKNMDESMVPRFIPGVYLFCDPKAEINVGDFVVTFVPTFGHAVGLVFRQLVNGGESGLLKALNPGWPQQYVEPKEFTLIKVIASLDIL